MTLSCEGAYADEIKWEKTEMDKVWQKILWRDEKTGSYARLIRTEAGFRGEKALIHDFDEVIYVLHGQQMNTKTGKIWHQGTFCLFPAGTEHGPFATDQGIHLIEFRYFRGH